MAADVTPQAPIVLSTDELDLVIDIDSAGIARLTRLSAATALNGPGPRAAPSGRDGAGPALADVILAGEGRAWSGRRYCESAIAPRLRYDGHEHSEVYEGTAPWRQLQVNLADVVTGLKVQVFYRIPADTGVLRSWVVLANRGPAALTVESVTSFLCGGLPGGAGADDSGGADELETLDVLWGGNEWLAEGRWQQQSLREVLPDLNRSAHGGDPRGMFGLTSVGTWSSGSYLPMGALVSRRDGRCWLWQIEHNGAWHWQVGEHAQGAAYLALLGPTDTEHHWHLTLAPGETFSTVPVAVAVSDDGFDGAVARLTAYRRTIRRPHDDHRRLPVIFNDYMNTLMGEPTTDRLLPLVEAAAAAGAEYFCIDAGWYAEMEEPWWDTVGEWKPATTRFPHGITEVLDRIRALGMVPGLWLEPEVVGVASPVAGRLPDEAFFCRNGQRVVEHGRYHLDLRHPAAVKHLDEVIDVLVTELGIGYFKLDYNINGGPGTDTGGLSAGAGLLGHNRAHLDWLDAVLDRHPGLVIENCASGGARMDYAMLSRLQLQSTSDQQDFLRNAAIAAAAPAAVVPEQGAVWAYPQPGFTDDEITFTLCNAMLGRVHLSGHLDRMTDRQCRLVAEAVSVYKGIRPDLARAVPIWPLGLPRWTAPWLALALHAPATTYLLVWHRGSLTADGAAARGTPMNDPGRTVVLALPHLAGRPVTAKVIYPASTSAHVSWDAEQAGLTVTLGAAPAACLIRLGLTGA
ncbi:MAG TPA: alpha-galactosidase [Trebonia sp.]|nr:alpha-galactosidase [Trebonia sp.]